MMDEVKANKARHDQETINLFQQIFPRLRRTQSHDQYSIPNSNCISEINPSLINGSLIRPASRERN